jgi:hypothetical protein
MIGIASKKVDVVYTYAPDYAYESVDADADADARNCLTDEPGRCQFAAFDSAPSADLMRQKPNMWLLPVLGGAIAVGYNLPDHTDQLRIPRQVLADIFLGKISRWSELAPWNPALARVSANISLVVRADPSTSSEVFTRALSRFSSGWKEANASSSRRPNWPRFDSTVRSETSMALHIRVTPYSLGYLSHMNAMVFEVPMAHISNNEQCRNGANDNSIGSSDLCFVAPSTLSIQAAMNGSAAKLKEQLDDQIALQMSPTQFALDIVNANGTSSYPIAMLGYFAFDPTTLSCDVLREVMYLIYWSWKDAEAAAAARDLDASPITKQLYDTLLLALSTLKCNAENTTSLSNKPSFGVMNEVMYMYSPAIIGAGSTLPYAKAGRPRRRHRAHMHMHTSIALNHVGAQSLRGHTRLNAPCRFDAIRAVTVACHA